MGQTTPKPIMPIFMPSPMPRSTMKSGRSAGGGMARRKSRIGST
jgi:hypothetical protein